MDRALTAWRGAAFDRHKTQPRSRLTNRGIARRIAAGGSRKRLYASQFLSTSDLYRPEQTRWTNIALGDSREPPASSS